ncbi:AAA family ATPase [Oscillospiraceae bacterium OttesenSCG-928-F05]|nr:AAA family ATPase [Oscillospiraceae bacterium OttesenSCG-928-F05]
MAKILAIVNQKGGVGKTTTCVNLTAALKERGKRVLVCDFDPQGNTTSGLGLAKNLEKTVYDLLVNEESIGPLIVSTDYGDVLPSNKTLSGAEIELVSALGREYRLKNAIQEIRDAYDFILIDCPPSLGLLTLNALCAADGVLVPVQCEYYALEGLSDLMYTIRAVKKVLNSALEIEGIVLTMYDSRTNLSLQVAEEVKKHFPGKIYGAVIPRNVRLSEAPSHGMPVLAYDRLSRGAESYLKLADEIIAKNS